MKKFLILICIMALALTGCQLIPSGKSSIVKLRVANLSGEQRVSALFTAYQLTHPEIEFEFLANINANQSKYKKYIQEKLDQSDIVIMNPNTFNEFVQQDQLQSLQGKMQKDWDWNEYYPFLKQTLQKIGGKEEIYGVMPSFESSTFVCNEKLFKEAGISIPEKQLTWDEFIELSRKVSVKLQRPSLAVDQDTNLAQFQILYAEYLNISMFNPRTKQLDLNNEKWKKIWAYTQKLVGEGILENQTFSNNRYHTPITFGGLFERSISLNPRKSDAPTFKTIAMPKLNEHTNINPGIVPGKLYAISKKSPHAKEAWEVLKYIMKDSLSRHARRVTELPSYKQGTSLNKAYLPFTQGESGGLVDYLSVRDFRKSKDPKFVDWTFGRTTESLMNQVIQKKITIDEALEKWQQAGQKVIDQFKEEK